MMQASDRPVAAAIPAAKRKLASTVATARVPAQKAVRKVSPNAAPKAAPKPTFRAAAAPAASEKVPKPRRALVRDSFTMPQADFDLIAVLKERALSFKRPTKKSELLRAGLQVLLTQTDAQLRAALDRLAPLKPGRPKKGT
jgi:hypothetical protein